MTEEFIPEPIYRYDAESVFVYGHALTNDEARAIMEKLREVLGEG